MSFLAAYRPCLHSYLTSHDVRLSMKGRTHDEARQQAGELAATFQRCCYEEESPARAPSV